MKTFTLFTLSILVSVSSLAQHFVSYSLIANRSENQTKNVLNAYGWNTANMALNGVKSYKISYNTTDVHGNPTIATGAVYVPVLECNVFPMVSYQHGTEFSKNVVPSKNSYTGQALLFAGNGYITVLPDYLGLGDNPGLHPYMHAESEATASIDLIRAAREFLNDTLEVFDNDELFIAGYSQGGHSTMALHK